jgi:hypothetical protein
MTLTLVATSLTALLLLAFLALALRAIRRPLAAAAGFGLPQPAGADGVFVRVYGSRNLAIALASGATLVLGRHEALAILLTCATPLTLFDLSLLRGFGGAHPPYGRHLVALALLLVTTTLWWLVVARGG